MDANASSQISISEENSSALWLQQMAELGNSKDGIEELLALIGQEFDCDRCYIFEITRKIFVTNTYEWCAPGVSAQIEHLQCEPKETIQDWFDSFDRGEPVIIHNLEDIREEAPEAYAVLNDQGIHSLIVAPIYLDKEVIGFIGVDNADMDKAAQIIPALTWVGNFLGSNIKMRDLEREVKRLETYDPFTGTYNLHAFDETLSAPWKQQCCGLIYVELFRLKLINANKGYQVMEAVLKEVGEALLHLFENEKVFHIYSGEFVVVCPDMEKVMFWDKAAQIEAILQKMPYSVAMGHAWSDSQDLQLRDLLSVAEQNMQADKKMRIGEKEKEMDAPDSAGSGEGDNRHLDLTLANPKALKGLYSFINDNYFDMDAFFHSVSIAEHYPFFGDMQSRNFYISDPLRELFGFPSNVVPGFLKEWEKFIPFQEDLELYQADISSIIPEKRSSHDLRYRVRDKNGNDFWIHCSGVVCWDEERTKPLFFSGGVTKLNYHFTIDPVTNFPKEQQAIHLIHDLQQSCPTLTFIGFRVNSFEKINELRGRLVANNLLKDMASRLVSQFNGMLRFFRLDGLRFLAVKMPECLLEDAEIARRIRNTIHNLYLEYNLAVRVPCSIGTLTESSTDNSPHDIMVDIISLMELAKDSTEEFVVHSMHTIQRRKNQNRMMMDLSRDVIDNFNNFRVVIQPIISIETGKIISGELLLRWKYQGKDVSPAVFVPMLEQNKLILPVGKWIFEQAVRCCKRINTSYMENFSLDFNVSYHQILDDDFLPHMERTLKKWQLPGNNLIMELTETHYDDSPMKLQQFIDGCKALNMRVALDDFGAGYSSLELLLKYPSDIVKLDRSLMQGMSNSAENYDFISSIVYSCHKFRKKVCVEGVETQLELDIATKAGCDYAQGYYFYRPLELTALYDLIAKNV